MEYANKPESEGLYMMHVGFGDYIAREVIETGGKGAEHLAVKENGETIPVTTINTPNTKWKKVDKYE